VTGSPASPPAPTIEIGAAMSVPLFSLRNIPAYDHRSWLRVCILSLDRRLRRHHGVREFCPVEGNLLRISTGIAGQHIAFADGTKLCPDDAVIDLHLWNERIPTLGSLRPGFAWASRAKRRIEYSLAMLAAHVEANPSLTACTAIRAEAVFLTGRRAGTLSRIARRLGFEVPTGPRPADPGHTLLAFALAFACHPGDPIWRPPRAARHILWMSRRTLRARYLSANVTTTAASDARHPDSTRSLR
jgi:hypothetical protein